MVLNLTKRQIIMFSSEMYAFFYTNGPTFISQHSAKMEIVLATRHETIHYIKKNSSRFATKIFYCTFNKIQLPIFYVSHFRTVHTIPQLLSHIRCEMVLKLI